jgi:hypothetical protein
VVDSGETVMSKEKRELLIWRLLGLEKKGIACSRQGDFREK